MTSPNDPPEPGHPEQGDPEEVRKAIQTQHPGLGDDIQHAIKTLRKLQSIAGAPPGAGPEESFDESEMATRDGAVDDNGVPVLGAGETFGRYQITRLLGRGGMGAVYLAYDSQLYRYVALKTPRVGNNPDSVKRFYREARAAATLRSPYICPVYDVGQIGTMHYLSMAFIDGKPLRQVIAEGQLNDPARVANIIAKVARGLQKAHEQGIIHRDIKSENIMIDLDGEPIVMDFGLAKQTDEDIHLTTHGRLLGSPAYMSPEQVEGDPDKIGMATDIYSLGVVLYEMLTGRVPFWGSLTSILKQIGTEDPARPSSLVAAVGHNSTLEKVCLKMMAKSPAERFATMAEVADILAPMQAGHEEKAPERRSWWRRLWHRSAPPPADETAPVRPTVRVAEPPAAPVVSASSASAPVVSASSASAPVVSASSASSSVSQGSGGTGRGSSLDAMPTADFTPPSES